VTFRLAHANVEQPDSALDTAKTIHTVIAHADVVTFNECTEESTHSTLRHLPGWDAYLPSRGAARENCIVWRRDTFALAHAGHQVVMRGGEVLGRRRGPSRAVTWALLVEKATGAEFVLATHHAVARADTVAKWRRPLRRSGFKHTANALAKVLRAHPGALVLTGDLNTIGRVRFAGLGLHEVKTPGTFGRRRYDRILTTSAVHVRDVHTLRTKSDHLALTARISLPEDS
jgi:endonuclease/exonuclease/phosphatase family metal-dependent hydrolase